MTLMNIFGNRKVQLQIVSQYSLPAYRSGLNGANVGLGALPGSFWHAQATDVIRTAGSTETLSALRRSRLRPVLIKTRVVRRQVPQNCSPQLQNVD